MSDQTHTMWSQTLLENLYSQLHTGGSDDKIRSIIQELRGKDIPPLYIVRNVRSKVGDAAADRVQRLAFGGVSAGGRKGKNQKKRSRRVQPSSSRGGLLASLKRMFDR